MKFLRWFLPVLSSVVFAQNVTIPNLPAAGVIVGTETIPLYQSGSCSATSGTCNTTPSALLTYVDANAVIAASQIVGGTFLASLMPALTGDCTTTSGTVVTTCTKTNGVAFGPTATIATDTGTGPVVLATSPTLVTPALGTPSAVNLTNATGLTAAALPAFTGDVTTSAGSAITTIAANAVTNAKAAQMVATTFKCNSSTSSANASDCNPLSMATMLGAVIAVDVISTSNITLSGVQTIDGALGVSGYVVLVAGQTTASQNGLYIMAAGAWSRAVNFPSGFVIPQFCELAFFIGKGTANSGYTYKLATTAGILTIGTSSLTFSQASLPIPSTTVRGVARVTDPGFTATEQVSAVTTAPSSVGGSIGDCVGFEDTNGSIGETGNSVGTIGPCVVTDAVGHIISQNTTGVPTASAGTLDAAASDQRGRITGLTGTTSITITFKVAFGYAPACGGSTSGTALGAVVGVTTVSSSAVTFGMAALTGSFNYWCF